MMVNTVGSYENKHWTREWSVFKNEVDVSVLTPIQQSILIGSMLGDGTMRIGKRAIHANFKVDHGLKQKEYVFWKYEILKNFVTTPPKLSYRTRANGEKYEKSWWFRTIRHPLLTDLYYEYYTTEGYRCGTKVVPISLYNSIDPTAIAVWIMDDGSYNQRKLDISTYSFSLLEVEFLCAILRKRFNILMSYYKDRDKGYRMYTNISETKSLVDLIKPYIIPTMMYKTGIIVTP